MQADIWNSIAGYVIINITGPFPESLINELLSENIEIWNISRKGGGIRLSIGIGGFYRLRPIARRYRCHIRIIEKHGLTVMLCHMGKRYIMAFGWAAVLAAIIIGSRYIWFIDVEGNDRIDDDSVIAYLSDIGIRPGIRRGSINTARIAEDVSASDNRIAWAGAQLTGVVLQLSLKEADEDTSIHAPGEPCSIYASDSGIISDITALSGKPRFNAGDAVNAGDELITGALGNDVFVEARGSVYAEVAHFYTDFASKEQMIMKRSGKRENGSWLEICGECIVPAIPPYDEYELSEEETKQFSSILPIEIHYGSFYELTEQRGIADEAALKEKANLGAEKKLKAELSPDAVIIYKQDRYETTAEGVKCTIQVIARQNIGIIGDIRAE